MQVYIKIYQYLSDMPVERQALLNVVEQRENGVMIVNHYDGSDKLLALHESQYSLSPFIIPFIN